jgi:amidase
MSMPDDPISPFIAYDDAPMAHALDGPLAGLTFAVKDIFDVAGYPTGCGNPTKLAEAEPARQHAAAVDALLKAGAKFAGKTQTVELAFGMDGRNDHYGTPVNPAAPDRLPGGSSSGSVAAAGLGLVDLSLGSDTGGSVRAPASFCGQLGLRPTFGRIDISGTMPLAQTLDTVGWFARNPAIFERVGEVLLGEDAVETALSRLVIADDLWGLLGPDESSALAPALGKLNSHFASSERVILLGGNLRLWPETYLTLQGYEGWSNHGEWIDSHDHVLSEPVSQRFEAYREVSETDYRRALEVRQAARHRMDEVLAGDGVVAIPTVPSCAPLRADSAAGFASFRANALTLTCAAGLSGCPQITITLATVDSAPLGLSLIAARARDRAMNTLARQIMDI